MKSNALKFILLFILLALTSIPMLTQRLKEHNQEMRDVAIHQRFIDEQFEKRDAEEKAKLKIYLMGKFDPARMNNFLQVPHEYTLGRSDNDTIFLREETLGAYIQMREAAAIDGISLKIASATRNFDYQKDIWNGKWSGHRLVAGENLSENIPTGTERFRKILEYSAAPGTSRHHWGTEIDINNANPAYFDTPKGAEEYKWLVRNAYRFGFCQTYTTKNRERMTGYEEEKWHWSYLPLARGFTQEYRNLISEEDINGFLGDEYASGQNIIQGYVFGINPDCF